MMSTQNEDSSAKPRKISRKLIAVAVAFGLGFTVSAAAAPATGATYNVSGSLDAYGGSLMEYGTYRYKPYSGTTWLRPASWPFYSPSSCGLWVRFALRGTSGTQVTQSLEWAHTEMNVQKTFVGTGGSTSMAGGTSYAVNGRTYASYSSCGGTAFQWSGVLGL